MKNSIKNIFVSHYHSDAKKIEDFKDLLSRNGMEMRDSSIYEAKSKNNAHNEDYIRTLIRPQISWAGTQIVLIGKETSKSDWVNWEIKYAAEMGKRIVGVYMQGESDAELPKEFIKHGDALRKWSSSSIIDAINGDDFWDGPVREPWNLPKSVC